MTTNFNGFASGTFGRERRTRPHGDSRGAILCKAASVAACRLSVCEHAAGTASVINKLKSEKGKGKIYVKLSFHIPRLVYRSVLL